jgi:drug/metabolite transporter (DMT)-like permease
LSELRSRRFAWPAPPRLPRLSTHLTGRTVLGYSLVVTAASLWGFNASISRTLLDDDISSFRLTELRTIGSLIVIAAAVAIVRPKLLKIDRSQVPMMALIGIAGLVVVFAAYLIAIERLQIGPAVTLQYLAPLMLLMWLWLGRSRTLAPSLWAAMAISLVGTFLVVRAFDVGSLNLVGVAAGLIGAAGYAYYLTNIERAGRYTGPATILIWALAFASLTWLVVQPLWSFPWGDFTSANTLLRTGFFVVFGTAVPFACIVTALRHVPAARVAIVATLEPVLAAVFAFVILDEGLATIQVLGGLLVVGAVIWVQSQRPDLAAESVAGGQLIEHPSTPSPSPTAAPSPSPARVGATSP